MNERPSEVNHEVICERFNLPSEITNLPVAELTGLLVAHTLLKRRDSHMLFDMDGVVLNPKNWSCPEVYPPVIRELQRLEHSGVDIGIATARGRHIHTHLREHHGLQFSGFKILEGGRLLITRQLADRTVMHSCYENQELAHTFVERLEQLGPLHPCFCNDHETLPNNMFCLPPTQWRRITQASFWYKHDTRICDPSKQPLFLEVIKPFAVACAKELSISEDQIEFQINQTEYGKTYLLISLKANTEVTKASHLVGHKSPIIYFADGDKDLPLALHAKNYSRGLVVAIASDLGESKRQEVEAFRKEAIVTLSGPDELAAALNAVHHYLTHATPMN